MLARLERIERTAWGRLLIWAFATPILAAVMALFTVVHMTTEYLFCGKNLRELLHQ